VGRILKAAAEKWNDGGPTKGNVAGRDAKLDDVEYVVGSHWKQRYLVRNEQSGGWQFMDKQFDRMSGKWEGYGQKNDWDIQCATCHTTGYKVTKLDEATGKVLEATMVEHNVGCEACHGPGAKHANAEDPFNKEYTGDLKDMWILDEQAEKTGRYDAGKHRQQLRRSCPRSGRGRLQADNHGPCPHECGPTPVGWARHHPQRPRMKRVNRKPGRRSRIRGSGCRDPWRRAADRVPGRAGARSAAAPVGAGAPFPG
jgi:hypothetical protein